MNRARWKEIDDHFARALALGGAEQLRFVREVLVRDPELGCAVKDLLESAREAEAVLGESALVYADPLLSALDSAEWDALHPGASVGGYRLLREIGRGDRSTIYLGEAAKGRFGKRVAIKVVARGTDTSEIVARIQHEYGRLLALEHPGIARFYSGGVTAGGLPYLATQLVEGRPLLPWCDEQRLDIRDRLNLFLQVCAAVQYGHRHLVAHGDLTSSRILVSGDGTATVLSFGFARLLQAEIDAGPGPHFEPVTTASDVWSLGAVLHQLLAGRKPYAPDEHERPMAERRTGTKGPMRLSDAAWMGGAAVSRVRATTPERLARRLRGELDAIVARALEQDPAQRYQSAGELADDIGRHLDGKPVHAHPGSVGHRVIRFARGHRAGLGVAALVGVALVVLASTVGSRAASGSDIAPVAVQPPQDTASFASPEPVSPAPSPPAPAAPAERNAEVPTPPRSTPATPVVIPAAPVVRHSVAPPGVAQVQADADGRRTPDDSAQVLERVASELRKAGKFGEAEAMLREALTLSISTHGRENLQVAERQWELGDLLRVTGRYAEAEAELRSSLRTRNRLADSAGAEVGQSLAGLALLQCEQGRTAEFDSLFARAVSIYRRLPADNGGLRMPETSRAQCR